MHFHVRVSMRPLGHHTSADEAAKRSLSLHDCESVTKLVQSRPDYFVLFQVRHKMRAVVAESLGVSGAHQALELILSHFRSVRRKGGADVRGEKVHLGGDGIVIIILASSSSSFFLYHT